MSPEAVEKAINEIVKEFNGRLDVFVANSGIAWEDCTFIDGSTETAKKVMAVNVDGVMWCAKSAGAHFRRQKLEKTTLDGKPLEDFLAGSFIATGSMSGQVVNIPQFQAVYNGSKAAVLHFCKTQLGLLHSFVGSHILMTTNRPEPRSRMDWVRSCQCCLSRLHKDRDHGFLQPRHQKGLER